MVLSWSAFAYVVSVVAIGVAVFWPLRRRMLLVAAATMLLVAATLQATFSGHGEVTYEKWSRGARADEAPSAAPVARLVAERDVAILGALTLVAAGALKDPEAARLPAALDRAYDRMEASVGQFPSPTFGTMLGDGDSDSFEMFVVAPDRPSTATVIFLHGYAGNFAVQCWHAAHAFEPIAPRTLCPSVGFDGAWWTPRGARILDAVLSSARADGAERVFLVGLSNGARGVATLARRRARELDGVVVISGAASTPPPRATPVLAIQGTRDDMFPARHARSYARAAGRHGTYAPLDGGHFVYLDRYDEVEAAIGDWLRAIDARARGPSRSRSPAPRL